MYQVPLSESDVSIFLHQLCRDVQLSDLFRQAFDQRQSISQKLPRAAQLV